MAKVRSTALTLKMLRDSGIRFADVTERWVAGIRKDLFGVIDLVYIDGSQFVGVQCTSKDNANARIDKAMASKELEAFLQCDATGFEVWGWYKNKIEGERRQWCARVCNIIFYQGKLVKMPNFTVRVPDDLYESRVQRT